MLDREAKKPFWEKRALSFKNLPNHPNQFANLKIGLNETQEATGHSRGFRLCKPFVKTNLVVSNLATAIYGREGANALKTGQICTTNSNR
jgi:hypothetical protein